MRRWFIALASGALLFGCTKSQPPGKVKVHLATPEDLATQVKQRMAASKRDGRRLLVYVGAKWCAPCLSFLNDVKAGKLNKTFPNLDLIKFDLDHDGKRLRQAGYRSKYIPLFALPGADGRASGKQFGGSVKGDKAVPVIVARLKALLASR